MITGTQLKDAILSASNHIHNNRKQVDELNIFPVPDGDTGTNMSMTIGAAARELSGFASDSVGECAEKAASAMLRGARGNSGVILSLLFRGFAKGLKDKDTADGLDLANALLLGVEAAYKAVMKPTEGTILTVARVSGEKGRAAATINRDALVVWDAICDNAQKALATTPDLLPVLKKAGVVDAGGKGLALIFEGMRSVFADGMLIPAADPSTEEAQETATPGNAVAEWEGEITFTYCTEFIVGRDPEIKEDPATLRAFLESIGDCVVVVDDDEIIKVHVHTEQPGDALQRGLAFGQLLTVKIENMREQKRKAEEAAAAAKKGPERADPVNDYGFVAVSVGDGLSNLFTDLGCEQIVSGGQTMNPSTEDILEAVLATPAKTVFVFPNNKNIIMAAEQAVALAADRKVVVVPTRTIPQGLTALLAFDPDDSDEENLANMRKAAERVGTGQVTFAARDSDYDGHKIREGEIISLMNGKLMYTDKNPVKAVVHLAKAMIKKDTSFVTLIYGEGVTEEQAEEARASIQARLNDDAEVTVIHGGQPIYYFIMSVE